MDFQIVLGRLLPSVNKIWGNERGVGPGPYRRRGKK